MFTYDKEAARAGSGKKSPKIQEKGDYIGQFTLVKTEVFHGVESVIFKFETDDNRYVNFNVRTKDEQGNEQFGAKLIHSMMCVLGISGVSAEKRMVEDYDYNIGGMALVERTICPELMGKRIGIVLYRYEKTDNKGNDKVYMNLACSFNAKTKQTSNEMMDNAPASALLDVLANLKNKDDRGKSSKGGGAAPMQHVPVVNPNPPKEDLGEDIPW